MKKIRDFFYISKLVRDGRKRDPRNLTQKDLNHLLGFSDKQGQFISNVERGICSVPSSKILKLSEILSIPTDDIIAVMVTDFRNFLQCQVERTKISKEQKV